MDSQRYKVTDRLDAGGMAEVFRGIAESSVGGLKRAVAIKRILPNLTKNKRFVQMFLDEARLALHLQHTNIVLVYDVGSSGTGDDTAYFLVMEFIDGCNLKVLLQTLQSMKERLPASQTLYIIMEICKALAYAHDLNDPETGKPLGIVHRDISPPNILFSKRGEVKLADFGLAKAASQVENTDPGVVKGKFSYLSPEAARGEEVDRRADIFAVGILMYELLTGKRLFDGETDYATVKLVREAVVPSVVNQNSEVTPELETIVRKALARDRNQRYQRVEELLEAVAHYLFSRGMKVTSRDIEQLVGRILAERRKDKPQPQSSLIDNLILDEMLRFTSLDDVGDEPETPQYDGGGGGGAAPLNPGEFVDPRSWMSESQSSIPADAHEVPSSGPSSAKNVSPLESVLENKSQATDKRSSSSAPAQPAEPSVSGSFRAKKEAGPPLIPIIMGVVTLLAAILAYLLMK
jgi:serine/threonine-protein kinase